MYKYLIHGISGAMGSHVFNLLREESVVGFDHQPFEGVTTYNTFENIENTDVIIDFSHFSMVDDLLHYAHKTSTPLVICTTGLTKETEDLIQVYAKDIAIFQSGNMSLGINVLLELAKIGARSLSGFDIEIIERHHNKKLDAPSGTAFMLAQVIQGVQPLDLDHSRYGNDARRKEKTIGMHAIRGGTITGDHTVLFAGIDETIELKHQATSKAVFAKGAVEAARFIVNREAGLYNMTDLIGGSF